MNLGRTTLRWPRLSSRLAAGHTAARLRLGTEVYAKTQVGKSRRSGNSQVALSPGCDSHILPVWPFLGSIPASLLHTLSQSVLLTAVVAKFFRSACRRRAHRVVDAGYRA